MASINALKDQFDAVYDVTVIYGQTFDESQGRRLSAPSMAGRIIDRLSSRPINIHLLPFSRSQEYFQGQSKELFIHIERIPMDKIPKENNEQISNWLHQRFQIKDK